METNIWREEGEKGIWMRGTNEELSKFYGAANIMAVRIPRMIMASIVGGKRRRGWPKGKWKKKVENIINTLKIKRWKEVANDRNRWRKARSDGMYIHILK